MRFLPFSFVLLSLPLFLSADEIAAMQMITLNDSSVIHARVTEEAGGFYLIKSPTLGDMKIRTADVLSIRQASPQNATAPGDATAPAASASGQSGTAGLRSVLSAKVQNFISTRDGMAAVTQFSQNLDLKAVLADPNVMKAIQSGDSAALMNSPSIKRLMENSQTKNLIQSILNPATQTSPPEKKTSATGAAP
ncbi:MAG: hypothetical protein WCQ16_11030 [Verrucomicrobiae bacterium]